jgi:poly [ADP-ribose] polymerase
MLKAKTKLLDELRELEQTAAVIRAAGAGGAESPVDACYGRLNCGLGVLGKETAEHALVEAMVANTHGDTHRSFALSVDTIFTVDRAGELDRYRPHGARSHGRQSHLVLTSIGTCSITAMTVCIFEHAPMEVDT